MKILYILWHLARRADRAWVLSVIDATGPEVSKYVMDWHHHNDRLKELLDRPQSIML